MCHSAISFQFTPSAGKLPVVSRISIRDRGISLDPFVDRFASHRHDDDRGAPQLGSKQSQSLNGRRGIAEADDVANLGPLDHLVHEFTQVRPSSLRHRVQASAGWDQSTPGAIRAWLRLRFDGFDRRHIQTGHQLHQAVIDFLVGHLGDRLAPDRSRMPQLQGYQMYS